MKKGSKMSEEAILKIKSAKANISDETRKKMSDSKKGRVPWNKGLDSSDPRVAKSGTHGIHPSEESKEKMRKAKEGYIPWNKGLNKQDPRIAKSANKLTGVKKTEEHCKNISLSKLGNIPWNNGLNRKEDERIEKHAQQMGETKRKQAKNGELNIWNKGLTNETDPRVLTTANGYKGLTKETSEKIKQATDKQSQTMKDMYFNKEIIIWNKGLTAETDPRIRKMSQTISDVRNQLFKEGLLEVWNKGAEGLQDAWNKGLTKNDHEGLMKLSLARIEYMANNKGNFISSHEYLIAGCLESFGLINGEDFIQQKYIFDIEDSYLSDIFIPKLNTIIEVDGLYWHSFPGRLETDLRRTEQLRDKGYIVLRFTDKLIEKDFDQVEYNLKKLVQPLIDAR